MKIEGSVFLVTGAGSGLGAAVARHLTSLGARVVVVDVDRLAGKAMAEALGDRSRFAPADVGSEEDGKSAVELALKTFGHLHGLVNCAGICPSAKVIGRNGTHAIDLFEKALRVNLIGTFNMIRLAAAAIIEQKPGPDGERGVIVNTASIAAYDGQIGQAAYAASKGGVASLTLPIARELARHGIRVVTIAPGIFETPMVSALPDNVRDALGKSVPFPPRLGAPEEYARLVQHICENMMLNGEVIRLDGALRMGPQ